MPTWIFRGFTNVGPDDGWLFTALGGDDTGGIIWHPSILDEPAQYGLYPTKHNMLIDTERRAKPVEGELVAAMGRTRWRNCAATRSSEMRPRVVDARGTRLVERRAARFPACRATRARWRPSSATASTRTATTRRRSATRTASRSSGSNCRPRQSGLAPRRKSGTARPGPDAFGGSHRQRHASSSTRVAERIGRFADIVGRRAGSGRHRLRLRDLRGLRAVHPPIAYAKLRSLAEGAAIASARLWKRRLTDTKPSARAAAKAAAPPRRRTAPGGEVMQVEKRDFVDLVPTDRPRASRCAASIRNTPTSSTTSCAARTASGTSATSA